MEKNISFAGLSSDFPIALRKRVDEYFKSNNIRQTGNWKLYSKTIVLFLFAAGTYAFMVFGAFPFWSKILVAIVSGLTTAGIGFCIMHDGAHGSYSQKPWLNNLMGYTLNMSGSSVYFWKIKHNVIHHNVTNIEGHDDDINLRPLMRTCEHQPLSPGHKYQHLYGIFLYSFTSIWWVFVRDPIKYFSGKIASKEIGKMPVKEHFVFWITKVVYLGVYLAIPAMTIGFGKAVALFTISSLALGIVLALVFQLAHVVEITTFPVPENSDNKIEHDWFYHQFATTANFATDNKAVSWFTGGLNFQVEHHLFPKISHVHYPEIRKITKSLCAEYNIPYNEFPTMRKAIISHFTFLKKLGREIDPLGHLKKKVQVENEELELVTA
jgi:linoleoyl-CoA desaturase